MGACRGRSLDRSSGKGAGLSAFDWLVALVLMLGPLVLVHEFGHFIAARLCGVRVLKFSIGFGPTIGFGRWRLAWTRHGTEYVVAWLPLGGFVKMLGEINDDEHPPEVIDACVAQGASDIVIHPYFLAPGRHASEDMARVVEQARARHPSVRFVLTDPLGPDPVLADLVLARAAAAGPGCSARAPSPTATPSGPPRHVAARPAARGARARAATARPFPARAAPRLPVK
ncbi:partial Regulator of sigma-E protease RseP, partial [Gammaproteobacteria bacterium]